MPCTLCESNNHNRSECKWRDKTMNEDDTYDVLASQQVSGILTAEQFPVTKQMIYAYHYSIDGNQKRCMFAEGDVPERSRVSPGMVRDNVKAMASPSGRVKLL